MQIHDLPNGTIGETEYTPIDNGATNRKTTLSAIGTYIINNVTEALGGVTRTIKDAIDTIENAIDTMQGVVSRAFLRHAYIADNTDINTITEPGIYAGSSGRTYQNWPFPTTWGILEVVCTDSTNTQKIQRVTQGGTTAIRYYSTSAQGNWLEWNYSYRNDSMVVLSNYTYEYSIAAGASLTVSAADLGITTPTGYSKVGIHSINSANNDVLIRGYNARGSASVVWMRNVATAARTGTLAVGIIYVRNSVVVV